MASCSLNGIIAACASYYSVQVVTLGSAISDLENAGEVNVKLSMHNMDKPEGSSSFRCTVQKAVCFVLDPPKETKRRKAGGKKKKKQDSSLQNKNK